MGPIAITFGLAGAGVFALNLWQHGQRPNLDGLWLSAMLFLTWMATNTFRGFAPLPWAWAPSALIDLCCLLVACVVASQNRQWWTWALAATFLAELALHVAFWAMWLQVDRTNRDAVWRLFWTYVLLRNIGFGAQLALLAWPGGAHALAGLGGAVAHSGLLGLRRRRL